MTIIGIDLGTTNSACAIWRDGEVRFIPNRLGELLTPSVVSIDEKAKVLVGKAAKERLVFKSADTVAAFKRMMGSNHRAQLAGRTFSAIELSTLVLKSLKEDAETYLGETVTDAVISVPAYFNDNQRQATKTAAELAGLKVERLINEPTAAAMAYGLHEKKEGTFMILDLGGGTFDVSILEFFDGVMEVHASAGDNYLGGEDFVEAMAQAVLSEFNLAEEALSPVQRQQLYVLMESAKRRVSAAPSQMLTLDLPAGKTEWELTSQWFADVTAPLLLRARRPIEQALHDAKLKPADIDEVVLVGGSTRLGVFRSAVGRLFGRLPACHLDPDTVIAAGAAIQAGLKSRDAALDDVVLTDVCPYTLGTGVLNSDSPEQGSYFMPIIERNSVVPVSIVRRVYTASDNQAEVLIDVYQGENRLVKKNVHLGDLRVPVPKAPAGKEAIDIRYSYDMNGLLDVDVTVVSNGKTYSTLIEHTPGHLSEADKAAALEALATLKFHPRDDEKNRVLLEKGERLYESSLGERREYISALLGQFDRALDSQQPMEISKARALLKQKLEELETEDWL